MTKKLFLAGLVAISISCSSSKKISETANQVNDDNAFVITEVATDETYGLSPKNPVEVGGVRESRGPLNEMKYLDLLTGPNGEKISYYRAGSCCPVKSENGFMGKAMLDNYRVTWKNSKDTVSIYINMYDRGELKAPVGFGIKKQVYN
ncbi:2-dehydro-3-deoxyphosphooctonate aldolase [Gramella sp. MT6]|uniref:2-dehydro-3-deoxyphosphooctonate aldolase n=1 Tax=Gramella sp. MT6 TaxID=2705471 RepID=UPI001C604B9C|nr:2-dehydro-3-deoxyphosphooctonate aldolase [Gramella sp. MT6]